MSDDIPSGAGALSGKRVLVVEDEFLIALDIQSILEEGGASVHAAVWDEGVVDYVQLFVAPAALGPEGVRLFEGYDLALSSLIEPKVEVLGPDTLIEGYVHRPH